MTDLRQAAQQALEALCSAVEPKKGKVYARGFEPIDCYAMHEQAITALREALARENAMHKVARLGQEIEQQQAEPCIGKDPRCPCQDGNACHYKDCGSTKALPVPVAQRPWQGLTSEEMKHLYPYGRSVWGKETYEAIEKALKERNHG